MECWKSEWKEEYNPGKSLWKGRSLEDEAEVQVKSETGPSKVKCTAKFCSLINQSETTDRVKLLLYLGICTYLTISNPLGTDH